MKRNRVYVNIFENIEKEKENVTRIIKAVANQNAPQQLHKRYECEQHKTESELCCSDCNVVV